uniref:F-box domain-containing protein n=1 Tax=Meloidogyne incognita TaxID=6306 RepID=A0A914LEH8_MELIC
MDIEKKLPLELLVEILKFFPLSIKWSIIRVSKYFDIFVLKIQGNWIVNIIFTKTTIKNRFNKAMGSLQSLDGKEDSLTETQLNFFCKGFDVIFMGFEWNAEFSEGIGQVIKDVRWQFGEETKPAFIIKKDRLKALFENSVTVVLVADSALDYWLRFSEEVKTKLDLLMNRYAKSRGMLSASERVAMVTSGTWAEA